MLLVSMVALAAALGLQVPANASSLEDEMRELLDTHPQIQARKKAISSAGQALRGARSGYMPTAKVSGDEGYEYIDSPDRRETQGKPFSDKRHTAALTVTQKIFDGFKTDATVDAAHASSSIAESDLRATRQSALLEGAIAYLEILRQTRLVALARESERKVTEQLNLEDERVQKGSGIATDVLSSKQRLQVAKERRVKFEGDFQTAIAKYVQVYGHSPDVAALANPPLPMDLIPASIDESLDIAEKNNPTLESAARTITLSDERRRIAEADYWPTLDLQGKADYEKGKNAVVGVRRDWSLMLVANWELFSGFKTDAAVAQASWDHAASKDNRMYASRKVSEAVRTAWHKLQTARQRLDLLENAATLAEELWEAQKKRHAEGGNATIQDVLDEENKVNDARIAYTGAFYDMYQAAYELLSGMGQLEVDNLARARPLTAPDLTPLKSSRDLMQPLGWKSARPAAAAPAQEPPPPTPARRPPLPAAVPAPAPVPAPAAAPGPAASGATAAMAEQMRGAVAAKDDFWTLRQ